MLQTSWLSRAASEDKAISKVLVQVQDSDPTNLIETLPDIIANHLNVTNTLRVNGVVIKAAVTTKLILSLFKVTGVVHYGTAGGVNSSLNNGDVVIPQYWAHLALWSWQLPLEANGDYTREFGFLNFANFTTSINDGSSYDNLLNNIWYQPEEIFPVDGTPEERQHAFWVPVNSQYFHISRKLEVGW
ncbi:hypothetical protein VNO77_30592 [Canavalia gladiata]|uniref:Nucleoside phosphorylase domain-containing protein n=1 Tax=Canavalia gladiata TaxID=3824 RepID=A0AAN9KNY1_CANGL